MSRKFSLPKDMKSYEKKNACSCKLNSCKTSLVRPRLVLNNSVSVCNLMHVTNTPYKFLFQGTHAVIFSVENKRLNFPVSHMYLGCVEATEQRKMTAFHCFKSLSCQHMLMCLVRFELIFFVRLGRDGSVGRIGILEC